MSDEIPEEIRKMFPGQPIQKMDIDADGKLQILASSEPLSNEPDFENMPMEKVNEYLRQHGYNPDQVGLCGKILAEALIENVDLRAEVARLTAARSYQVTVAHVLGEGGGVEFIT